MALGSRIRFRCGVKVNRLPALFLVCACFAPAIFSQEPYWNKTWNFCVSYPPGWSARHPVDEYAIEFHKDETLSMSFGVVKDNEDLDDNFRTAYLSGSVDVIRREHTLFNGRHAITATLASKRPSSATRRVMTVAGASNGVIYEFQLSAPDLPTLNRYMPIFESELASFKFDCR